MEATNLTEALQDFPSFHHISTGDSLRQHVQESTSVGLKAKEYMDQGKLVPDDVMIEVVMEDATPLLENGESLLLDGFPRTLDQAKALNEVARMDLVVNLDIPTETIVERIADRYVIVQGCRLAQSLLISNTTVGSTQDPVAYIPILISHPLSKVKMMTRAKSWSSATTISPLPFGNDSRFTTT